jgi:hypothetical protein
MTIAPSSLSSRRAANAWSRGSSARSAPISGSRTAMAARWAGAKKDNQVCLAHLIRDVQYAIDAGDGIFAPGLHHLLGRACRIGRRRDKLADVTLKTYAVRLEARLDELMRRTPTHKAGVKLQRVIKKIRRHMFVFVANRAIPATNNALSGCCALACDLPQNHQRLSHRVGCPPLCRWYDLYRIGGPDFFRVYESTSVPVRNFVVICQLTRTVLHIPRMNHCRPHDTCGEAGRLRTVPMLPLMLELPIDATRKRRRRHFAASLQTAPLLSWLRSRLNLISSGLIPILN